MKEVALEEAKDQVDFILNGIGKTRDKLWQILAFLSAINFYLITEYIKGENNSLLNWIMYISIAFTFYIFFILYSAMFPAYLKDKGFEPKKIKRIMDDGDEYFYDALLKNYQTIIDTNGVILDDLSFLYKKSLRTIMFYVISTVLFIASYSLFLN